MKILNVISYWGHEYGGPFINTANLAASLMRKGHEVSVVTTSRDPSERGEDYPWSAGGEAISIKVRYFGRSEDIVYYSAGLKKYLKHNMGQFDAVFIQGLWRHPLSCAAYFARKHGIPYCIYTHGMMSGWSLAQSHLRKKLYFYASAKKDIAKASAILYMRRDELDALSGLNSNNILFKNALHLDDIRRLGGARTDRPEQKVTRQINLLFLSRIHPKKGLDVLVQAMRGVIDRFPEVYLTIAGPAEDKGYIARIHEMADKDGTASHIRFVGTVDGDAKINLLAQSDIFILPTEDDCKPLALLEAMASGMPVITTPGADLPEIDGKMGAVVAKTTQDLERAIIRLIEDKAAWGSMGRAGQEFVLKYFTWEERAGELEGILAGMKAVHG